MKNNNITIVEDLIEDNRTRILLSNEEYYSILKNFLTTVLLSKAVKKSDLIF